MTTSNDTWKHLRILTDRESLAKEERAIIDRFLAAEYQAREKRRIDHLLKMSGIKRVKRLRTLIVHIPIGLFAALLRTYALFSRKPPFTADQLKALSAGDDFKGVDTEQVFGVRQTPFEDAIRESYTDPRYASIVLER